jgi:hypothetical protein
LKRALRSSVLFHDINRPYGEIVCNLTIAGNRMVTP